MAFCFCLGWSRVKYTLIFMCKCMCFQGRPGEQGLDVSFCLGIFHLAIIFIGVYLEAADSDKPTVWAVHVSMSRVSQDWWARKVTEGKEERRLAQTRWKKYFSSALL